YAMNLFTASQTRHRLSSPAAKGSFLPMIRTVSRSIFCTGLCLLAVFLTAACGTAATPVWQTPDPTATRLVSTEDTSIAQAQPQEATNTPEPPTATPVPPTNT